jgi:hypothetical protein
LLSFLPKNVCELRKWFPSLALLLKEERDAGAPLSSIAKGHFKIDIPAESHAGESIFVPDAHRDDGMRFVVRANEKLSAFVELERQVLTVTFYLESICACR